MSQNVSTQSGQPIPEDARIKNRGRYGKYWDKRANVRLRRKWYGLFIFLAIAVFVVALVDMGFLDNVLEYGVYGAFALMALVALLMYFTRRNTFSRVHSQESSLEEALLQCPECKNIFDFRETHFREHQKVAFSCPVCGTYGALPGIESAPVKKRVPEGDLRAYEYRCANCREDIRVGVFGAEDEVHRSEFRACPHCGEKGTIEIVKRPDPLPEGDAWEAA